MRLIEAFDLYQSDVIIFRNQSAKTEENHLIVKKHIVGFFGDIEIETLTFPMVRQWKIELEKKRSPETVRNYIIKLRVVLAYLNKTGITTISPDLIPVPQRTDKVPEFITKEQVTALIDATTKIRNKAIIALLFCSGVRVSELCRLDIGDIREGRFTVVGKGGKARLCFVDARADRYIKQYLKKRRDNHSALFVSDYGRITAGGVQDVFKYARGKANLPNVSPHTMRHSFATNLLRSNMNIRYVQTLLGHSSLETTMMYTHVIDHDLQKQYEAHHLI